MTIKNKWQFVFHDAQKTGTIVSIGLSENSSIDSLKGIKGKFEVLKSKTSHGRAGEIRLTLKNVEDPNQVIGLGWKNNELDIETFSIESVPVVLSKKEQQLQQQSLKPGRKKNVNKQSVEVPEIIIQKILDIESRLNNLTK